MLKMASKWPWLIFTMLSWGAPPPNSTCPHTHIQTDGDYTKHVVTPFGTTRLKIIKLCESWTEKIKTRIVFPISTIQIKIYFEKNIELCQNRIETCRITRKWPVLVWQLTRRIGCCMHVFGSTGQRPTDTWEHYHCNFYCLMQKKAVSVASLKIARGVSKGRTRSMIQGWPPWQWWRYFYETRKTRNIFSTHRKSCRNT